MKKRGFTLIELLAVIVILAIIALIATPIVMNVIESSRKGAAERSYENYLRAVETAIAEERINGPIVDGTYEVMSDGSLCNGTISGTDCTGTKLSVEVSGTKPAAGSKVKIENGLVVKGDSTILKIGDYTVKYDTTQNKVVATKLEEDAKECFSYAENYDYEINEETCLAAFGEMADEQFDSEEAGKVICRGEKKYGDLVVLASVLNYSVEDLENAGIISNVNSNNTLSITGYNCGNENASKTAVIPKTINGKKVTEIATKAFSGASLSATIGGVVIPDTITKIGYEAFYLNNLQSLTIPASVTEIGAYAFLNNRITILTIPNSVIKIGDAAFYNNDITSLTISNSVTYIGDYAFEYNDITSLTIPNSVTDIGKNAFASNELESVIIKNTEGNVSLGEQAFGDFDVDKIEWVGNN